jgi:hypothetical protein
MTDTGGATGGGVSLAISMLPPWNEGKVYASTDGAVSWKLVKDGFEEPTEFEVTFTWEEAPERLNKFLKRLAA